MFIDTLSIASTFVAAIVGIVGNTWDPKQSGINKLTKTGWVLVAISLIALCSSIYQVLEKNRTASTKEQVAIVAYKKVLHNINDRILVMNLALADEIAGKELKVDVVKFYADTDYMKQFLNEYIGSVIKLSHVKLSDTPKVHKVGLMHKDMAWWKIFSDDFMQARSEIEIAIAQYGSYMDPETLLVISRLIQSDAMTDVIEEIPGLMKESDSSDKYPIRTAELLQAYYFPNDKPSLFDRVADVKQSIRKQYSKNLDE